MKCLRIVLGILLCTLAMESPVHGQPLVNPPVSPNVPLNSTAYMYLEKLDGLGYIQDMLPSTKPYTRLQIAYYIQQAQYHMDDQSTLTPLYVQRILNELETDFSQELDMLAKDNTISPGFQLKEISLDSTYYDGDSLVHHKTKSSYQPLNINHNGRRFAEGANTSFSFRVEGMVGNDAVISLSPEVSYDDENDIDTNLDSGYIKTKLNGIEIQYGKDPMWWGPGERGTLALSNNAAPMTGVKLSNMEPLKPKGLLKFLGNTDITTFYGDMDYNTDNLGNKISDPSFLGFRMDFNPHRHLTFGAARTSILGGSGHELSSSDLWHFLTGTNAETQAEDKWNSIAGLDFRLRLPQYDGMQLYGEWYGEDQEKYRPAKMARIVGVYIPRITKSGDWDAKLEYGRTTNWWYAHWVYTDGYIYKGDIIGDAMGYNAHRYYAKFTHYDSNGPLSLHLENVEQDVNASAPQQIKALWLEKRVEMEDDLTLTGTIGVANIHNKDYIANQKDHNYLMSVGITKKY